MHLFRSISRLIVVLAVLAAVVPTRPSGAAVDDVRVATLERISFAQRQDGRGQVVRLHVRGRVSAFGDPQIGPDGSVRILLYDTGRSRSFRADDPRDPIVHYQAREQARHMAVTLQVAGPVKAQVYRDRGSSDLLVNMVRSGTPAAPAVLPPTSRAAPQRTLQSDVLPSPTASIEEAAARWRIDTIVIDPGHGGKDPGAAGPYRLREKNVVLPVARKLGSYLEELLGVNVVYTRQDDRFIELRERGRIANRAEGDLFISIHANWARAGSAHGTETYFLGKNKESQASSVIERENSVIQLEKDPSHYEQFDQAALVQRQLAQSAFLRQSADVARRIEDQFENRVGRTSRGVKEGNLQVLWAAAMPAVLVELGFISNSKEARYMASDAGVTYLASAIFRAVRDFKEEHERSLHLAERD